MLNTINADGMIEVFKWKQMDFYNRGSNPTSSGPITSTPVQNAKPKPGIYTF